MQTFKEYFERLDGQLFLVNPSRRELADSYNQVVLDSTPEVVPFLRGYGIDEDGVMAESQSRRSDP